MKVNTTCRYSDSKLSNASLFNVHCFSEFILSSQQLNFITYKEADFVEQILLVVSHPANKCCGGDFTHA